MKTPLQRIVLSALFIAFTCVATMLIKFPTPAFGYIHVGDCMVLLCGVILGPGVGALAAGIGSALADLFSGYLVYVPATFVIKALTALLAGLLYRRMIKKAAGNGRKTFALILGGILGESFMVGGYFVFETFLAAFGDGGFSAQALSAGLLSSAASIPFNLVQGATGIILSVLLLPILMKVPFLRYKPVDREAHPVAQEAHHSVK